MINEFKLQGKLLVQSRIVDGKQIIGISGVLEPSECPIEIDDKNEMWAAKITINQAIAFIGHKQIHCSPEDFMENVDNIQDVNQSGWKRK